MNQFYVYHCTYPNGRKYVGSKTVAPEQSPDYYGSHPELKQDLKSMNKEHIVKEILFETDDIVELEDLEFTAIKQHNAVEDNIYYNSSLNTKTHYGIKRSEETKRRIGIASAKRKHSDETRKQISMTLTGSKRSTESVLKIAIALLESGLETTKGYQKQGDRYYSRIKVNGKLKMLGSFGTLEEAKACSLKARKKHLAELKAELKELQGE